MPADWYGAIMKKDKISTDFSICEDSNNDAIGRKGKPYRPQHILKSSRVRDITVMDIANMTELEAFQVFVKLRYKSMETVVCPHCAVIDKHYFNKIRLCWRCKHCTESFSVTRGTPFQDHKLSFKELLMGLLLFISEANGISIHKLSRELNVQVKTAQAFLGKIREAIYRDRSINPLTGLVQIDGGHFGGRPRHGRVRRIENTDVIKEHVESMLIKKTKRPPKTAKANFLRKMKNRRVVMVVRQLHPEKGMGANRTIAVITHSENEENAISLARKFIDPDSLIMTDENAAYNQLSKYYEHQTVEHAKEFSTIDGVNDNQAESYFSRLRRHVLGVSHRIEPKYMQDIAHEMAWREDVRKMTQFEKLSNILNAFNQKGLSRWWRGYWQGYNRPGEILWVPCNSNLIEREEDTYSIQNSAGARFN